MLQMQREVAGLMEPIRIGSEAHKELFCTTFVETHRPFEPEEIVWPHLEAEALQRLRGLPVWSEAARTESETAIKVQTLGSAERDPVLSKAIALQGYEEGRHASVIGLLIRHYGISAEPFAQPQPPKNPVWTFMSVGYGECIDSFFAFGLFEIGRRSQLFPAALLDIFEPIVQEEARHILFLVNWAAYLRAQSAAPLRPLFDARRGGIVALQLIEHARHAASFSGDGSEEGFEMKSHAAFGDISAGAFLELCLSENDRRLAPYDLRLLRPRLVPMTVRAVLRVLKLVAALRRLVAGESATRRER
ncbi:MAG TPA: ferritin-like domain-containing protein [Thermoanaerobaculia bacterium]|nr:ferritin-like domain-containing protein [Thermoanaerobaculia bacterium]